MKKSGMKKRTLAALLAALALLLSGCAQKEEIAIQDVPELLEPVSVKIDSEPVVRGMVSEMAVYDAEVVPYMEELSFPVSARVLEVCVTLGQWVNEGDVLMRLDQEDAKEQVQELKESIEYTRTMNNYDNRQKELDVQAAQIRVEQMTSAGAGSAEIERARLLLREAEVALRQQKEMQEQNLKQSLLTLEKLENQLAQEELVAPISGYVLYKEGLKKGSWVEDSKTVMCIADPEKIYVQSDYIATSSFGEARVYVLVDGKEIEVIQREVDSEAYLRYVLLGEELKSEFDFKEGADLSGVEAGQFAVICYEYNRSEDTLWIPANAILSDAQSSYVYVVGEDGAQERRNVKSGQVNTRQVEILEGLEEGERVYVRN